MCSKLAPAGTTASAVMVPGTVFKPLTQQVVVADAQFQLETQLPNLVKNSRRQFIIIKVVIHMTSFAGLGAYCLTCAD